MADPIPRPDPAPRCHWCGEAAAGVCNVPRCAEHACTCPNWHPYADPPAPAALSETAKEAAPEPARCECQSCPWHLRDWPRCVLSEGHDGAHDPGPGPHPWVPVAEVEAARAEGYLAGRKFERAALCDLLRKLIDLEDDERVHYEREVAELERQAKANRECAEASRARADGLRALLARVEALS